MPSPNIKTKGIAMSDTYRDPNDYDNVQRQWEGLQ